MPNNAVAVNGAKRDAERAGVTNMGFNLAVRKLTTKKFVRVEELWDERDGEPYNGLAVDEDGWKWIEANESRFVLHRQDKKKEEDIPF